MEKHIAHILCNADLLSAMANANYKIGAALWHTTVAFLIAQSFLTHDHKSPALRMTPICVFCAALHSSLPKHSSRND
jgi:hypothetical protein